jgi:phage terminase large subunit
VDVVSKLLRDQGDGRRGLYWVRDAIRHTDERLREDHQPWCSEMEMENYAYPQDVDGKGRQETPLDLYNHGMDAMRYAIMYVAGQGSGRMARTRTAPQ